ncbi:MAG: TRAP transporter substrate-binding protein [bacterium]
MLQTKNIFITLTLCLVLLIGLSLIGNNVQAQDVELKAGLILPSDHVATQATERMAELVSERTDGEVKIEVYPSSQLGQAPDMLEGMGSGTIDMFVGAVTWLGSYEKDYWLPGVLYLFEDQDMCREIHRGPYFEELAQTMKEEHDIMVLTQDWDRGARHFLSTDDYGPILEPEDLKEFDLRVPEQDSWIKVFELVDADPTPVALEEAFTGLQQGVISGMEGGLDWTYQNKYYEVAPNISLSAHNYEQSGVFISELSAEKLTEEQLNIIEETSKEVGKWQNEKLAEEIDNAKEEMEDEGVKFHEPNRDALMEHFRDRLWPELQEEIGYSEDLVDHIMEQW